MQCAGVGMLETMFRLELSNIFPKVIIPGADSAVVGGSAKFHPPRNASHKILFPFPCPCLAPSAHSATLPRILLNDWN